MTQDPSRRFFPGTLLSFSNLKDWAHEGQKEREEVPVQEEAVFGMDSRVTE